ncbi:hypothetical protein Glove_110g70 [Diversispora epigaea]|uniref:Protein kinase domain-containing protein n=1 Tax=Diversispora epigaea TaxID=1348612 RepID=A0A397JAT3_9GLOM|nr:hypothetical protein Glove_110g70 [Diversispora epigaea]
MSSKKICPECNQENTSWCKPCNSKHFQNGFDKWTSGNDAMDKFIQDAQFNANSRYGVIEWIPYDRLEYIKQIAKGGFGTIHLAKWIDGPINEWDIENQQWIRYNQEEVVLKKFDNFANLNEDFFNEMAIHLKSGSYVSIQFYGITQDPETHKYIMVLRYAKGGNLRDYLKNNFNNINWEMKLNNLSILANRFKSIHKLNIVHQDFHPGNILSSDYKSYIRISDFGLSKLMGSNPNNPTKKNVFGVLPYISPEVLSGEEYKKEADVYSFGIIVYEMVTGIPPYHDISHDKDLAIKICNGLRPKIPFHIPKLITRMIMRCWDARVRHRPTFEELYEELKQYFNDYRNYLRKGDKKDSEIVIQIKKDEEFSTNQKSIDTTNTTPINYQTHPQAIYTSRLLNFSNLPKPTNEENFEKELEYLSTNDINNYRQKKRLLIYLILHQILSLLMMEVLYQKEKQQSEISNTIAFIYYNNKMLLLLLLFTKKNTITLKDGKSTEKMITKTVIRMDSISNDEDSRKCWKWKQRREEKKKKLKIMMYLKDLLILTKIKDGKSTEKMITKTVIRMDSISNDEDSRKCWKWKQRREEKKKKLKIMMYLKDLLILTKIKGQQQIRQQFSSISISIATIIKIAIIAPIITTT